MRIEMKKEQFERSRKGKNETTLSFPFRIPRFGLLIIKTRLQNLGIFNLWSFPLNFVFI